MSIDWYHYITEVEKILEDTLGSYCLAQYKKRYTKDYLHKLKQAINENSSARPNPNIFSNEKSALHNLDARHWLKAMTNGWSEVFIPQLGTDADHAKQELRLLKSTLNGIHHTNKTSLSEVDAKRVLNQSLALFETLKAQHGIERIRQMQEGLKQKTPTATKPPVIKLEEPPPDYATMMKLLEEQVHDGNTVPVGLLSLRMVSPLGQEKVIPLVENLFKIGRAKDNHVVLEDNRISSHHAIVVYAGRHGVLLMDMGSRNGTWLDGIRLNEKEPSHWMVGKRVVIGNVLFELQWSFK
jgi:hypothetical protein